MLQPDFKEFSRLAREATLVPVVKSVSADLLTPVSAFLAIAEKEPHAFLLESVERGRADRALHVSWRAAIHAGARRANGKVEIRARPAARSRSGKCLPGREEAVAGASSRQRSGPAAVYRRSRGIFRL